jgi:hypothetical protein
MQACVDLVWVPVVAVHGPADEPVRERAAPGKVCVPNRDMKPAIGQNRHDLAEALQIQVRCSSAGSVGVPPY